MEITIGGEAKEIALFLREIQSTPAYSLAASPADGEAIAKSPYQVTVPGPDAGQAWK